MFTGIVEEMGQILQNRIHAKGMELEIGAQIVLEGTQLGDSIAVNGTCLTVTAFNDRSFKVDVAPETRSRTNLEHLKVGSRVNLERACTPSTRLGGHMVQGHVDGLGELIEKRHDQEALWLTIGAAPSIMRYLVPKGFVCLDGTSLTLVDVWEDRFSIMLVPYTQKHIVLPDRNLSDVINIEVDIVGKYVEKFLGGYLPNQGKPALDLNYLKEHGFSK